MELMRERLPGKGPAHQPGYEKRSALLPENKGPPQAPLRLCDSGRRAGQAPSRGSHTARPPNAAPGRSIVNKKTSERTPRVRSSLQSARARRGGNGSSENWLTTSTSSTRPRKTAQLPGEHPTSLWASRQRLPVRTAPSSSNRATATREMLTGIHLKLISSNMVHCAPWKQ
jgi:hypothetical protein